MNLMVGTILLVIALMTLFLIMSGVINKKDKIEILRVEPKDIVGLPEMIKEESKFKTGDIVFAKKSFFDFVSEGAIGLVEDSPLDGTVLVSWEEGMSMGDKNWWLPAVNLEKIGEL